MNRLDITISETMIDALRPKKEEEEEELDDNFQRL